MKKTILFLAATLAASAATPCDGLVKSKIKNTTITAAQLMPAGQFTPPGPGGAKQSSAFRTLAAFCRVSATITPVPDSEIKIEVWMPTAGWNGNLQSVGNGAWAGAISYPAMVTALAEGYATASTDTGHSGNSASFITGHPEKLVDFAYRAVHEMTVSAKAVIAAHYGNGPRLSFWNGCSTGGRQAFAEAQRYPEDYDGIVAGAPANYVTRLQGAQLWVNAVASRDPAAFLPAEKYPALHNAALAACDAADGVRDGVLEHPNTCRFDPAVLLCKSADGPLCLTAPQVNVARQIYEGMKSPFTGKSLFPGLEPGSELGWSMTAARDKPVGLADDIYKLLVHQDANWDYKTFHPDTDVAKAERAIGSLMNSVEPNLKPFFDHKTATASGGKLLIYHGWADPGVMPRNTVNYYQSVVEKVGAAPASNSMRLFMVPGMGHCRGGDGTDTFDAMTALRDWVESNKAPDRIAASKVRDGKVERTRPLCPYPQVATYRGTGSTDELANFSCLVP